jgi:hypothetical protein
MTVYFIRTENVFVEMSVSFWKVGLAILRWFISCINMNPRKNAYRILVGKPERKRLLRRPRHR